MRLTPRDNRFYDHFAAQAAHLVRGAELLTDLLAAAPAERALVGEHMREAEHAADDETHAILSLVNQTFVTPFEREDIYALAGRLDDMMDAMEEAVDLVVLYRVDELPPELADTVKVLTEAARLTAEAMGRLRTLEDLADYSIEINRLENDADRSHRRFLARLFSGEFDAMTVMKLKDVAEALESAADAFEHVAHTVETIAAKES